MEIEIYHVDQAINGSKEALEAIIENIDIAHARAD